MTIYIRLTGIYIKKNELFAIPLRSFLFKLPDKFTTLEIGHLLFHKYLTFNKESDLQKRLLTSASLLKHRSKGILSNPATKTK